MSLEATITDTIQIFVNKEKSFTSVDISNEIKKKGIWIRNIEVRNWLKKNYATSPLLVDYNISQISVCNNSSLASLYHPVWSDPNNYTDRNLRPLTPDDVKKIQADLKNKLRDDTTPDISDILNTDVDDKDDGEEEFVLTSVERLKIPGALIRKLGWKPGDKIDPALILTSKNIPSTLTVNKDYRVSIPRSAVDWGTNPVKLKIKNGRIAFEKV